MANSMTDQYLENNTQYAAGQELHTPFYPGTQPIQPAKRLAVVTCMDARLDVENLLGLQTGEARIIRNAGGVVTDDVIRCLIISHHLLNTNEITLIHHTRCGMLTFTDDLLKAGRRGTPLRSNCLDRPQAVRSRVARPQRRPLRRSTRSVDRSNRSTPRATHRTRNGCSGMYDEACRRFCTIAGFRPAGRTRSQCAASSTMYTRARSRR
jgi:carbonic anhydrase